MNGLEVKEFRKKYGLTQLALSKKLGVDIKTVQNWESGKNIPATKNVIFRNIAAELDGNLISESVGNVSLADPETTKAGKKSSHRMIPFYDAETTGGYVGRVASSNEEVHLKGYIDAGGWFDGRETAAIRHTGESMIEYPNGCILAVREVKDIRLLVPGRNYVIETDEYRITKRVQKGSTPETLFLYSTNQEKYEDGRLIHEPFEVHLEDVRRIFSVLGYIVTQSTGKTYIVKP